MYPRNECRSHALALLLLLTISNSARAATVGFQPAVSYPVGLAPFGVAVGDFNADGTADLAVLNGGDGTISLLLGKGDGTFNPAMHFSACQNCTRMAASDFDADNKSDLAVLRPGDANRGDNGDVTIFLSNGDGTFHKGQVLSTGKNPAALIIQDVDADHKADLIVGNATDSTLAILLGKGDGTFLAPVHYATNLSPFSILVVDFDQDGLEDLTVNGFPFTNIFLANGDGTFRKGPGLTTYPFFRIAAWADLNRDGNVDYVVSGCDAGGKCGVKVALGNGDGTFQSPGGSSLSSIGGIFVADYDGDAKLDIAGAPHLIQGQIDVLPGNGDGTFQPAISFAVSSGLGLATVADLNNDKAPDLVTINSDDKISVLLNNGTDFSIAASKPMPAIVSRGASSSATVSVKLMNAFDNPVTLSCSVQPTGSGAPNCSLNPSSITPGPNGSATATLTINAASSAAFALAPFAWPLAPIIGLVGGVSGTRRKRKLACSLAGGLMFVGLLLETACSGGSKGGPPAQSYTVTITGSSTFSQHSTSVTLGIQ